MEGVKYIIDRYIDEWAVLENTETQDDEDFPRAEMPKGSRPGHTVILRDGAWHIDHGDTDARAERIKARFDRIRKANGLQ